MGEGAARVLSRAGRRSAGLGSDGGARTYTHTVGVRAHGAVCVPQTGCGDAAEGAICSAVDHRWFLTGRRYEKLELANYSLNWKYFQYLFSAVCLNKKKAFHSARSLS